jgi:hypothetical protein
MSPSNRQRGHYHDAPLGQYAPSLSIAAANESQGTVDSRHHCRCVGSKTYHAVILDDYATKSATEADYVSVGSEISQSMLRG